MRSAGRTATPHAILRAGNSRTSAYTPSMRRSYRRCGNSSTLFDPVTLKRTLRLPHESRPVHLRDILIDAAGTRGNYSGTKAD